MAGKLLDETGLAELWSLIKTEDSEVTALANTKAKIAAGSYVGTGSTTNYGNDPISLTFDFPPQILYIMGGSYYAFMLFVGEQYTYTCYIIGGSRNWTHCKRIGNTAYWSEDYSGADANLNTSGETYYYVAIG